MDREMIENALFFLGGTLALAILFREMHGWWLERKDREAFYAEMKSSALEYIEELYKEVGKR